MSTCVLFGGAGFVGKHLINHFLSTKRFSHIHIADIKEADFINDDRISYSMTDVRSKIENIPLKGNVEWIFNLAAVHREPGHKAEEYFETNLKGATNICEFAERFNCPNIFFTSSISVYGPVINPTDEDKLPSPRTPYGSSKFPAELIHEIWQKSKSGRRLVITRPGVIYGPGDPGNILRMINAIKKGYFVFPGKKNIHKSYAYIYGFIDSIDFVMSFPQDVIIYNYVETPTQTISEISEFVKNIFNSKAPIVSLPPSLLVPVASILQKVFKKNNPIHPVRVRKAGTPTHIIPKFLIKNNFVFKYNFKTSVEHWQKIAPEDFK